LLVNFHVTARRWQNLAKYFFDVSKVIVALAVIGKAVSDQEIQIKTVAFGLFSGVLFFWMGLMFDRKGDE